MLGKLNNCKSSSKKVKYLLNFLTFDFRFQKGKMRSFKFSIKY